MEETIRILIAENDCVYRDGLRLLIENTDDFELVAAVNTTFDAVKFSEQTQPHVVIMELNFPQGKAIRAAKQIIEENPTINLMFFTSSANQNDVFEALQLGVRGYLLKGQAPIQLKYCIRLLASGNLVFDKTITNEMHSFISSSHSCQQRYYFPQLTNRENHVLQLVSKGLRNKEIAHECAIAEKTVRNHISNIFSKLEVSNRMEAIVHVQQSGLNIAV